MIQRIAASSGGVRRGSRKGGAAASKRVNSRRNGIDRVMEILECLYARGEPLRPNQIASSVGAPRSTVYAIVNRLVQAGFLQSFDSEGRVFLGRRLHYFGIAFVKRFDLMREAQEMLRELTERTSETSQLCMLEGGKYIVALMRVGDRPIRITVDVGQRLPLPWTASGPLLVSDLSDVEIIELIPEEDFVLPDGRSLEPSVFIRRVHEARKRGLSRLDGQMDDFSHCIAAPVMNSEQRCVATLCLVAPRTHAIKRGNELIGSLVEAAAQLSKRLGGATVVERSRQFALGRAD